MHKGATIRLMLGLCVLMNLATIDEARAGPLKKLIKGRASFYAHKFHGRKTASGATYDENKMTCAHRTLPFGTLILVRCLDTDKEVIVEVTDRGPFHGNRVLDLSRAAARKLGITGLGNVVGYSAKGLARGVKETAKLAERLIDDDDEKVAEIENSRLLVDGARHVEVKHKDQLRADGHYWLVQEEQDEKDASKKRTASDRIEKWR